MPPQRTLPFQVMTAEDRQFDALLRQAEQHFQEVTVVMQRQRNISRESPHGGEANRGFARNVANGEF